MSCLDELCSCTKRVHTTPITIIEQLAAVHTTSSQHVKQVNNAEFLRVLIFLSLTFSLFLGFGVVYVFGGPFFLCVWALCVVFYSVFFCRIFVLSQNICFFFLQIFLCVMYSITSVFFLQDFGALCVFSVLISNICFFKDFGVLCAIFSIIILLLF